jgi:hypothetical protein
MLSNKLSAVKNLHSNLHLLYIELFNDLTKEPISLSKNGSNTIPEPEEFDGLPSITKYIHYTNWERIDMKMFSFGSGKVLAFRKDVATTLKFEELSLEHKRTVVNFLSRHLGIERAQNSPVMEPQVFTTGAYLQPMQLHSGRYGWVVTGFEDATFKDGIELEEITSETSYNPNDLCSTNDE